MLEVPSDQYCFCVTINARHWCSNSRVLVIGFHSFFLYKLGFTIDFKCQLYCQNCSGNCSWIVKASLAEFAVGMNAGLSLCTIQNGSLDSKERQTRTQATWTTQSNLALTWKPDVCVLELSHFTAMDRHKCVWPQEESVSLIIGLNQEPFTRASVARSIRRERRHYEGLFKGYYIRS